MVSENVWIYQDIKHEFFINLFIITLDSLKSCYKLEQVSNQ